MGYLKVFSLLVFVHCALSEQNAPKIGIACGIDDVQCVSNSVETFVESTYAGITDTDFRALDPFIIPSIDLQKEPPNLPIYVKNVNVTGIRKLKVSDFKMDTKLHSMLLEIKAELNINAERTIILTEKPKTISGNFMVKGTTLGVIKFNYSIKADDKGVERIEVGPETITCVALTNPEITIYDEFAEDPVTQLKLGPDAEAMRKTFICKIAVKGFETVMHNIRTVTKILPKSDFFFNIM